MLRFNPLPTPEYRKIKCKRAHRLLGRVSIRSLHQSTGRSERDLMYIGQSKVFQSAPCTRVQGDLACLSISTRSMVFQSAPCTRVQGDSSPANAPHAWWPVSIRSLHQSTGRLGKKTSSINLIEEFQSAPCTRVQGDRPNPKNPIVFTRVSIRSLHQSTGRFQKSFCFSGSLSCFNPLPAPEYREIRCEP